MLDRFYTAWELRAMYCDISDTALIGSLAWPDALGLLGVPEACYSYGIVGCLSDRDAWDSGLAQW